MRVEAVDVLVIALNILEANGTGGIELLEAMSSEEFLNYQMIE